MKVLNRIELGKVSYKDQNLSVGRTDNLFVSIKKVVAANIDTAYYLMNNTRI